MDKEAGRKKVYSNDLGKEFVTFGKEDICLGYVKEKKDESHVTQRSKNGMYAELPNYLNKKRISFCLKHTSKYLLGLVNLNILIT